LDQEREYNAKKTLNAWPPLGKKRWLKKSRPLQQKHKFGALHSHTLLVGVEFKVGQTETRSGLIGAFWKKRGLMQQTNGTKFSTEKWL